MKITSCAYLLPNILLLTIITELGAVDDPCSKGIDNNIVADMCKGKQAVENSADGTKLKDSVIVRVMKQKSNCTCRVSLINNTGNYSVQMKRYRSLNSSVPPTRNCGLAIDVDYPGFKRNVDPIQCTSGTNKREIVLEKNGVIKLKSRIIGGNFTRGYCMQIYRVEHLESDARVQLNIQCDDPEETTTIPTTHALATTKYKDNQLSNDEIASTTDIENDETSTVTTKGYNKEDEKLELYIYIGAGGGGVVVIIAILLIILCRRNRSKKKSKKEKQTVNDNNDTDSDNGELKDNILYVSSDPQDIIEDGNYSTVDLEKKRIANESRSSGVGDSTADGNYSSTGTTDNSPNARNKPKLAVNFVESDKQRQQISTFENGNNEYAVVDKGRQSSGDKHATPLGVRNSSEKDTEMSVIDQTYAVVDKTNSRKADE